MYALGLVQWAQHITVCLDHLRLLITSPGLQPDVRKDTTSVSVFWCCSCINGRAQCCDCVWFGTQFYEAVVWFELFPAIKLIENKMFLLQCVKTTECSDNEWLLSDCCSLGLSCKACFSVLELSVVYKPKYCQKKTSQVENICRSLRDSSIRRE